MLPFVLGLGLVCDAVPRVDACADLGRPEKPAPSSDLFFTCACNLTSSRRDRVGGLPYFPLSVSSVAAFGNGGRLWSRVKNVEEPEPSEAPAVVGRAEGLSDFGGSKSLGDTVGRRWGCVCS